MMCRLDRAKVCGLILQHTGTLVNSFKIYQVCVNGISGHPLIDTNSMPSYV